MQLGTPFRHALPVTEHVLAEPLHVTYTGWIKLGAGQPYLSGPGETPVFFRYLWNEGRILPEFCLVLIRGGQGELETRHGIQRIPAGTAFLLRPGEWHRHQPSPDTGWTNLWIAFNGELPRRWMREGSFHLTGNIAVVQDFDLFVAQFERLLCSVQSAPNDNSSILSYQLIGILSHFLHDGLNSDASVLHADELVSKALAYIWGNLLQTLSVPDVAQHLGCHRRSLERRFKDGTGRSVLDEIQACRIDRAKRMLEGTPLTLKETALRAGFRNGPHMRQVFRAQFGLSPEAFRESTKGI
ncbi:helix-turn-helix domain-containing protein [Luteolibacter arcticus]|uniref:Helix-turn-helix domain-containing protein n=1 Tax=Luteolibacter arcticus TaxID=1581411 RepID=A0ABT3GI11_9BACT|nr:helix-turn-helix domain-containing protein [Luteolibacter arcticus]MCW1923136.1 helix-turn-helix domain-containing protein [Luteolibacter arcticus]